MDRELIAEIDLKAISHNFNVVKKIIKKRKIIAVVKADAYGHGAIEVSRQFVKEGADYVAVAYTSEAVSLRESGIDVPIIVLFDKGEIQDYFRYKLIPVIHDIKTAQAFSKEAKKRKKTIDVHIKVDTGMGRLGFNFSSISDDIGLISKMDSIRITGLMSHFSDADLSDRTYATMQFERFNNVKSSIVKKGVKRILCHMANSAAILSFPESHLDAVRPGLMLYGYSPIQLSAISYQLSANLRPAMTVKTKILSIRRVKKGVPISYGRTFITVRDSLIAVLPVGYADGYLRIFSNNSDVLIKGKRAPVVGRVCMDTTMVDITEINGVTEGDEVVLLGSQKGNAITASELAMKAGTISYEILTSFGIKSRKIHV
jgi:alanine racemase